MGDIDRRLQKLEQNAPERPVAFVWCDWSNEAKSAADVTEREASGFHVVTVGWRRPNQ